MLEGRLRARLDRAGSTGLSLAADYSRALAGWPAFHPPPLAAGALTSDPRQFVSSEKHR